MESNATVEEASNKAKDLVKLFARGGFKVTEFVSKESQLATDLKQWNRVDMESRKINTGC